MTMVEVRSEAEPRIPSDQLYLDDLHVGQRFTSGTHRLDEAQIKAFALQFDPQPFHTDKLAAERTFERVLETKTARTFPARQQPSRRWLV
jgi:acyl dehydratase